MSMRWEPPPPKKGEDKDIIELRQAMTPKLQREFLELVAERQRLNTTKKDAEAALKELNETIAAMVATTGHKTVVTPDWKVTWYESHGPSIIEATKLLEKGVDPDVIEYATKPGKEYTAVQITAAK